MKDIKQNTQLPLFESDNFKVNFPEDFEGESYSESASNIVEEIKSVPEESVPNGKSEANLEKRKIPEKEVVSPCIVKCLKLSSILLNIL